MLLASAIKKCGHTVFEPRCQACKELYEFWNNKLDSGGYEDVERSLANGERVLTQRASNAYRALNEAARKAKERYFELISGYVQRNPFRSLLHKYILMRISDGASIVEISRELKRMGQISTFKSIRFIIRKYERKWKIKSWAPEKMRQKVYKKKKARTL